MHGSTEILRVSLLDSKDQMQEGDLDQIDGREGDSSKDNPLYLVSCKSRPHSIYGESLRSPVYKQKSRLYDSDINKASEEILWNGRNKENCQEGNQNLDNGLGDIHNDGGWMENVGEEDRWHSRKQSYIVTLSNIINEAKSFEAKKTDRGAEKFRRRTLYEYDLSPSQTKDSVSTTWPKLQEIANLEQKILKKIETALGDEKNILIISLEILNSIKIDDEKKYSSSIDRMVDIGEVLFCDNSFLFMELLKLKTFTTCNSSFMTCLGRILDSITTVPRNKNFHIKEVLILVEDIRKSIVSTINKLISCSSGESKSLNSIKNKWHMNVGIMKSNIDGLIHLLDKVLENAKTGDFRKEDIRFKVILIEKRVLKSAADRLKLVTTELFLGKYSDLKIAIDAIVKFATEVYSSIYRLKAVLKKILTSNRVKVSTLPSASNNIYNLELGNVESAPTRRAFSLSCITPSQQLKYGNIEKTSTSDSNSPSSTANSDCNEFWASIEKSIGKPSICQKIKIDQSPPDSRHTNSYMVRFSSGSASSTTLPANSARKYFNGVKTKNTCKLTPDTIVSKPMSAQENSDNLKLYGLEAENSTLRSLARFSSPSGAAYKNANCYSLLFDESKSLIASDLVFPDRARAATRWKPSNIYMEESESQEIQYDNDIVENDYGNKWFLQHDYEDGSLCLSKTGQVQAGTLKSLVKRLTQHDRVLDKTFVSAFLLLFRHFTSPDVFFNHLISRFCISPPENLTQGELQLWRKKKQTPIKLRTCNIFKLWIENFWFPDTDDKCLLNIRKFAEENVQDFYPNLSKRLIELVDKRMCDLKPASLDASILRKGEALIFPPILPKNMKNFVLADIDPLEVARQLTIIVSRLFNLIKPYELVEQVWGKKNDKRRTSNVKAVISISNKITYWVSQNVLKEKDVRKRALMLKFFIKICAKLVELQNYDTLMSIKSAITMSCIARLKKTWSLLSSKTMTTYDSLSSVLNFSKNFSSYRAIINGAQPPCTPFLGLYLTDLTFTESGIPTYKSKNKSMINFSKYMKIYNIIQNLQYFQEPYGLEEVHSIQCFLLNDIQNTPILSPSKLYEISLEVEPKTLTNTDKNQELIDTKVKALQKAGLLRP